MKKIDSELPKNCASDQAEKAAMSLETVSVAMQGREPRKIIVVPNRVVNIVL